MNKNKIFEIKKIINKDVTLKIVVGAFLITVLFMLCSIFILDDLGFVDNHLSELYFTEISIAFLILTFITFLSSKTNYIYWMDKVEHKLLRPPFTSVIAVSIYIIINVLYGTLYYFDEFFSKFVIEIIPILQYEYHYRLVAVSFIINILLIVYLTGKLILVFFEDDRNTKFKLEKEYETLINNCQDVLENLSKTDYFGETDINKIALLQLKSSNNLVEEFMEIQSKLVNATIYGINNNDFLKVYENIKLMNDCVNNSNGLINQILKKDIIEILKELSKNNHLFNKIFDSIKFDYEITDCVLKYILISNQNPLQISNMIVNILDNEFEFINKCSVSYSIFKNMFDINNSKIFQYIIENSRYDTYLEILNHIDNNHFNKLKYKDCFKENQILALFFNFDMVVSFWNFVKDNIDGKVYPKIFNNVINVIKKMIEKGNEFVEKEEYIDVYQNILELSKFIKDNNL